MLSGADLKQNLTPVFSHFYFGNSLICIKSSKWHIYISRPVISQGRCLCPFVRFNCRIFKTERM